MFTLQERSTIIFIYIECQHCLDLEFVAKFDETNYVVTHRAIE